MRWLRTHLRLAVVVAIVLLLAAAVAVARGVGNRGNLGTADPGPAGARALATLLAAHGVRVVAADSAAAAARELSGIRSAGRAAGPATGPTTLFVTAGTVGSGRLLALWTSGAEHVVLVDPPARALSTITGLVTRGPAAPAATAAAATVSPGCPLAAAVRAGTVRAAGPAFAVREPARTPADELRPDDPSAAVTACYARGGEAWLVRRVAGGRTLDLVGSTDFLTNAHLAGAGDAALALNLLGGAPTLVWYRPSAADAIDPGTAGDGRSLVGLLPHQLWAVAGALAVATVLLAFARGRRLGRLVPESLPVTVRASETARGRARLYRRTRARPTAIATLRAAALAELAGRLGLVSGAPPGLVMDAVATRTGLSRAELGLLLDPRGGIPTTDAELLATARALAELRGTVRSVTRAPGAA